MRVFIYAYEDKFQGYHGISDQAVVEVNDIEEANQYGSEMAEEVINSYSYFINDRDEEDEFEEENGTAWIIFKICDDIELSTEELNSICSNHDYESFVEEYCEKEELV